MTKPRVLVAAILFGCLCPALVAQHQPPQGKPDHMDHRFEDPEKYAKSFDDPARDAWQMPARVVDALKLSEDASVADIGAGTGYFSVRLAKVVPRGTVYAVDIEPKMLEHIRKRADGLALANLVTVQGDSVGPRLPKAVDLALVVDTYHHIPNRVAYFKGLAKVLTANGRLAIIDFRKDAPDGPPPQFRFEAAQIIDEMTKAGYRLDVDHGFLPRQHFLVFRAGR
jgi:ubiquinone/menaquinone biosynthesis C-methylase UbiE